MTRQVGAFGEVLTKQSVGVSLDPRCQGLWGSQKNTGMPVATPKRAWSAISRPWSQVRLRRRTAGGRPIAGDSRRATRSAP